jgi:hypothetical protein
MDVSTGAKGVFAGRSTKFSVEASTYSQRPMLVFLGHMQSEFGQVLGLIHVRSPLTVVIEQLHLAGSKDDNCAGCDGKGDNDGSTKVNKGSVLAEVVVRVVDGCQFGHTGVSHLVIALTDCPEV